MNQLTPRANNKTLINEVWLFALGSLGTSGFSWYDSVYWSADSGILTSNADQKYLVSNGAFTLPETETEANTDTDRMGTEQNGILRTDPHEPFFSISVSDSVIIVLNIATVYCYRIHGKADKIYTKRLS